MILKQFNLEKKIIEKTNYFLLYGPNEGLKEEAIEKIIQTENHNNLYHYEENEILADINIFLEKILNESFFEDKKIIIISKSTNKIVNIIEDIIKRNIEGVMIILKSGLLEKKSKLRSLFEEKKNLIIIPFYNDDFQSLFIFGQKFFHKNNLKISSQILNLIVEKSNGDRMILMKELEKILSYSQNKKNLELDDIRKLINNFDKIEISDLVDQCILKNKKKTNQILNENTINLEDNILILKNFLYKLKRLKKIKLEVIKDKKIEIILNSFKPPIFWKDKDIIKKQLNIWTIEKINKLIKKTNNVEFQIKRNSQISKLIFTNYILEHI